VSSPSAPWRSWPPGLRVVVRRVLDDVPPDAPPPHYTDVVGDVLAVDDAGVLIRTRRHGDVHVPAAVIRLTKVVPPARPRRRTP
jgi:hypothetical protein